MSTGAHTPIVAGFHPDPSICRAGDRYYLINSSFEYLPGIPIHSSTDLLTWTPVGNVLTRPAQMAENPGYPSAGVFAPTIRHHGGTFWIVGTNVNDIPTGCGHFIVRAEYPAGPWSDPVFVAGAIGIDPDLAWDEEGSCHLTWASLLPDQSGILSAPIDPTTGEMLGRPRQLWQGTGLASPEGPHLYRIGEWWYLLLAEGGTERGHAVTIARARSLDHEFEAAPNNPILSHRSTGHPVQSTGHADLVELAAGSWAVVYLGTRPRGQTPGFHVNGRESFLAGIDWVDGWPVVDVDRFTVPIVDHSFVDDFSSDQLHSRWVGVGRFPTSFTRPDPSRGLIIDAVAGPGKALLATRTTDTAWTATAEFDATDGVGRFVVRIDDAHWYGLAYDGSTIEATLTIGPVATVVGWIQVPADSTPVLRVSSRPGTPLPYGITNEPDLIELAATTGVGPEHVFGAFDGRYLSTEVAGGFTGRLIGVEAVSGSIRVSSISYTSLADTTGLEITRNE